MGILNSLFSRFKRTSAPTDDLTPIQAPEKVPLPGIPVDALQVELPFRIAAIDTETTGTSIDDRIVSWAVLYTGGDVEPVLFQGLVAPDVPIKGVAQWVHGISNEYAQAYGVPPVLGIEALSLVLPGAQDKIPLAGQKVEFDLGFIEREIALHGYQQPTLDGGILDTMHLGRDLLNGERRSCALDHLYLRFGVSLDPAWRHTAAGDALGVARVLEAMWRTPRLAGLGLDAMRRNQQMRGIYLRLPK